MLPIDKWDAVLTIIRRITVLRSIAWCFWKGGLDRAGRVITRVGCVHEVARNGVLARVFMFWDEVND